MRTQLFTLLFTLITLALSWQSEAGEFTGAGKAVIDTLERNHISVEELKRSGHQVIKGEFSGAGKRLNLGRISYFVTGDEVIEKSQVDLIQTEQGHLRPVPGSKTLGEVKALEAFGRSYRPSDIQGLVIK